MPLDGKSLLLWTIDVAVVSGVFDKIFVSSEDAEVEALVFADGRADFSPRSAELATDQVSSYDVLRDFAARYYADRYVLLQPTSPLRTAADIRSAIECFDANQSKATATVVACDDPHKASLSVECVLNRQDGRQYVLNGAVYVFDRKTLLAVEAFSPSLVVGIAMPVGRSIDIDTIADFELARKRIEFASHGS